MPAYIIVQLNVTDPETFEAYRQQVVPTIEKFGGEYVVRGGEQEILEGEWPWARCVILKFADMDSAKAWHGSDDYAAPKALRQSASKANMIVVEGV